jgi:hypothetical protein
MRDDKNLGIAIGDRIGRWTAVAVTRDGKYVKFVCRCDCGTERAVRVSRLLSGKSKSCGCYRDDQLTIHGMTRGDRHAPEYAVWNAMIARCHRPNTRNFKDYGGRGITVCARWHDFASFIGDMGPRPPGGMIERINNDGGYSPENCRWASRIEQASNTRRTRLLTLDGESRTLAEWSRLLGIHHSTVLARIKGGWSEERALSVPVRKLTRNGSPSQQ